MSDLFRRLGSRDAKPNPDAFWSDKWGWMDEASPADLVAVVRRGVESGTIKGEVVDLIQNWFGEDLFVMNEAPRNPAAPNLQKGVYLLLGPISDGGSET